VIAAITHTREIYLPLTPKYNTEACRKQEKKLRTKALHKNAKIEYTGRKEREEWQGGGATCGAEHITTGYV
jgi:hypothetical protein